MILKGVNDGELENIEELRKNDFNITIERDFSTVLKTDGTEGYNYKYNFVGFITDSKNDIISVFPKKYRIEDLEADSKKIFRTIFKHKQQRPDMYIGEEREKHFKANFPFFAFYAVYEHYKKYGVHFEEELYLKAYGSGKVNWKETIRLSEKFIIEDKLVMLPIYHNQNLRVNTFIATCMIFVIDYTLDKFHYFIDADKTNYPFPEFDFLANIDFVQEMLHSIRSKTYNDININLITNIIDFFNNINEGGNYYLKHYSFYAIWEQMIKEYLNQFYLSYTDGQINFSPIPLNNNFLSPNFHPNLANKNHSFKPDFYLIKDGVQLLFDAKYYDVIGMDYKQIAYLFFLASKRDSIEQEYPTFTNTHTALIIPSGMRRTTQHFKMDPIFNKEYSSFSISEERLDICEIIDFWINL